MEIQKSDLQQPPKFKYFFLAIFTLFFQIQTIFLLPVITIYFGRLNLPIETKFYKKLQGTIL